MKIMGSMMLTVVLAMFGLFLASCGAAAPVIPADTGSPTPVPAIDVLHLC